MNKKPRSFEIIAESVKPGGPLRDIVLLFAVFYLVYLLNSSSLRIVWMDWCNFNVFRDMHGWSGFSSLLTNAWQASPRVQFLSWMLQAITQKFFGDWAAPHFALSLGAHFVSAVLVGKMTRRATASADAGRAAAVLYLVFPTSAGALFVINNAFFVLSFSAVVLTAYFLMFPPKRAWVDLIAVTGAALTCQFLGEQTLPLLYLTLACFGLRELRGSGWRRSLLRAGIPLAACAATLVVYYFHAVKPYAQNYPFHLSFSVAREFAEKFLLAHLDALNFSSWMYGALSLPPSPDTVFIAIPLIFTIWLFYFRTAEEPVEIPAEDARLAVLFLAAGLASTFLPVLYSAITGYRTAVETRYLYCSGLIIAVMLPILFNLASRRLSEKPRSQTGKWLFLAASSYLGVLMIYDLRDIWGAQKELDQRIWTQVDANFSSQVKYVATDGLQFATLMPLTRSNAISDFHEEFGVRCRIKTVHGVDVSPLRRPIGENGEFATAAPYRSVPQPVKKSELLSILFRYEKTYRDLLRGKLVVFPNYDDYARYRKSEPFEFK
jgi:hypothetical protein